MRHRWMVGLVLIIIAIVIGTSILLAPGFWRRTTDDPNTFFVALFTGVLAVSTSGLWSLGRQQSRDMAELLNIARSNANASAVQATAMEKLRAAAEAQERAIKTQADRTGDLAEAARRSAAVAERALVDLERPLLVVGVRDAGLTSNLQDFRTTTTFSWSATNYGRSPALLLDRVTEWVMTQLNGRPPTIPGDRRGDPFPAGLVVGNREHIEAINLLEIPNLQALFNVGAAREYVPFFFGFIRYGDVFGGVYVHGFCFQFDLRGSRFVRFGGDEYNYTRTEIKPEAGTS